MCGQRVARWLQWHRMWQPDGVVALQLRARFEQVTGVLGVLSGLVLAYLPLDPNGPAERRAFMV